MTEEVTESLAIARDGSAIDHEAAAGFVREQIWAIWSEVNDRIVGDVHSSSRVSRAVREEAVQEGFHDLLEEVAAHPENWLITPTRFDRARFTGEWAARARRHLNNWQRSFHEDLAAGLETERIGGREGVGADGTVADVHPALAWADARGIELREVYRRFPPLLEQESYVPTATLLMWCTGRSRRRLRKRFVRLAVTTRSLLVMSWCAWSACTVSIQMAGSPSPATALRLLPRRSKWPLVAARRT